MRIVVALGGNALLERGEVPDSDIQEHHVERAATALAPLARRHELVVNHGNGPQVGVLAQESAGDRFLSHPYPLDVLGAQTQGMIGYWLVQALGNALCRHPVVAVVSRTVVAADDPAFGQPTKFVGPVFDKETAARLTATRKWQMRQDGAAWRRVVASPRPRAVLELPIVAALVDSGAIVVCAGGGGIPVVEEGRGYRGVEAVVDKDHTAALLAIALHADRLLLLTDVPAVMRDFGTTRAAPVARATTGQLNPEEFAAGSMGPKVEAASLFVESTGGRAGIGRLEDAEAVLEGTRGTTIGPA